MRRRRSLLDELEACGVPMDDLGGFAPIDLARASRIMRRLGATVFAEWASGMACCAVASCRLRGANDALADRTKWPKSVYWRKYALVHQRRVAAECGDELF